MKKGKVSARIATANRERILSRLEREASPFLTASHRGILEIWLQSSATEKEMKVRIRKLLRRAKLRRGEAAALSPTDDH